MPKFDIVSVEEAMMKSATGRRAQVTREYLDYIDQLAAGQAGRLQVVEGETIATVRRRLGVAAKLSGKSLVIKRMGDNLYFWAREGAETPRRRGRPRRGS